MINPFGIVSTVVLFKIFDKYKNFPLIKPFPPLLVTGICLILILKIFDIDYKTYNETASWLTFFVNTCNNFAWFSVVSKFEYACQKQTHNLYCIFRGNGVGVVYDVFDWKILSYRFDNYFVNVA